MSVNAVPARAHRLRPGDVVKSDDFYWTTSQYEWESLTGVKWVSVSAALSAPTIGRTILGLENRVTGEILASFSVPDYLQVWLLL